MHVTLYSFLLLACLNDMFKGYNTETITYMDMERPVVTFKNDLYIKSLTITSRRIDRIDPRHYCNVYIGTLVPVSNNFRLHIYVYQWTTNRYQPSFVELHLGFCDIVKNDVLFGTDFKRNIDKLNLTCPYPPGQYNLTDLTVKYVPKNFPFNRGRIFINATITHPSVLVTAGYVDMEIKQTSVKKNKP